MRPEQEKAREYLYKKGTLLAPREIHERVRAAFAATEEFLAGVSETEARVRPAPEEWCVQEVVGHLVETHRPSIDELDWKACAVVFRLHEIDHLKQAKRALAAARGN